MIDVGHYNQATHGRQQGCCACLGHLRVHPFPETLRARLRILATGSLRFIVRCTHTSYVSVNHLHMLSPNASCTPGPKQANGLFKNYADDNSTNSFYDASSSALLAATVYRLALLTGNKKSVPEAERTRAALFATNGTSATPSGVTVVTSSSTLPPSSTSSGSAPNSAATTASNAFANTPHFTVDGWLTPVVDPLNNGIEGAQSPEAQAFTLMLQSAWRDWSAAGSHGANVAPPGVRVSLSTVILGLVGLVVACPTTIMDGGAIWFSV